MVLAPVSLAIKANNFVQQKNIRFKGDTRELYDFLDYGVGNKSKVIADEYNFKRNDINEDAIYKKITSKYNLEPALITGKPQSGKSVTAGRMVERLKKNGEKVLLFENDIRTEKNIFSYNDINLIKETLTTLKPDERLYVFIDEPQFIPSLNQYYYSRNKNITRKNVLYELSELIENNPKIKLVGVMYDNGFNYSDNNDKCLLTRLFPEKNHIVIPQLKIQDKISIINTILGIAGFEKIPAHIEKSLKTCIIPIKVRQFLEDLFESIKIQNYDQTVVEPIANEVWQREIAKYYPQGY